MKRSSCHATGARTDAGFGLLEVVLSTGILALVLGSVLGLLVVSVQRTEFTGDRVAALTLAEEGIEIVRAMRDTSYVDGVVNHWADLLPAPNPSQVHQAVPEVGVCCRWQLLPGEETITLPDGRRYVRTIQISLPEVPYVPQFQALVPGGEELTDAAVIRKIRVTVRWGESLTEQVESITYLTDWRSGV